MKFNMYFKSLKIMQFIDYNFKKFSYINLLSGSCKKKKGLTYNNQRLSS